MSLPTHAYPRPQLVRPQWLSLDGKWDFAIDAEATYKLPQDVAWTKSILVPFAPETKKSGIADTSFYRSCWYRRTFTHTPTSRRTLLHFGAIDYKATVWVNNIPVAQHEGGYTPFTADITDVIAQTPQGDHTIVIRAQDDPHDLSKPRGKQDWQLNPHSIWYPRTTGIWQTVWLEDVPETWLKRIRWTSSLERWEIGFEGWLGGVHREPLRLKVKLTVNGHLLSDDTYTVVAGEVHRRVALSDPGIDDYRNEILWSPENPVLIQAELELWGGRGELIDKATSYTALRSVTAQDGVFVLNGRPYPLRLVLDQGYWPQTGLTAPSDAAFEQDITLVKAMGFNGVRKHQKIEDPRFLYHADRMGLLVWEEMPSAYRFTNRSVERLTGQWREVIERDNSHPCIITWVPLNESWGVPDLPSIEAQRHYVQALYHLTKTLDPTRPVVGNDGWEHVATDILAIHDYELDPTILERRYQGQGDVTALLHSIRPGGRALALGDQRHEGHPLMLTEFGGLACSPDKNTWGYGRCDTEADLERKYIDLLTVVNRLPVFAGFCYTQLTDTYQEANGLLYADRTPKIPLAVINAATRGLPTVKKVKSKPKLGSKKTKKDKAKK